MGMFDEIRVEYPLEGIGPFVAQTKDLENALLNYRIDRDGRLWLAESDDIASDRCEGLQSDVTGAIRIVLPDCRIAHFWIVDGQVKDVAVRTARTF